MRRVVTVGLDGSPESAAAADWAAREAQRRGTGLRLLHVVRPRPGRTTLTTPTDPGPRPAQPDRFTFETATRLNASYPELSVMKDEVAAEPVDALLDASEDAELLVLGSRGRRAVAGFFLGSAALGVVGRAHQPIVLVRAGEQAAGEHKLDGQGSPTTESPYRPVVLGLDLQKPNGRVIEFAFDAAASRGADLKVIHSPAPSTGNAPASDAEGGREPAPPKGDAEALAAVMEPWQGKFPQVDVTTETAAENPAGHLLDAAENASLLVMGRQLTNRPIGSHIGTVSAEVLRRARTPVALVPHGV